MKIRFLLLFFTLFLTANTFSSDIGDYNLGKTAKEIKFVLEKYEENDEEYLFAVSDFHAVFDIDMDDIAEVITDHDNGEKVFSRMIDSTDLNPEDDLSVPHFQRVHNSAKFLGIGQDYVYTTIVSVEKHTDTEFLMNWHMTDCEEGNFQEYKGFWALERLDSADSEPRTYVRLYAETVFNNLLPFQELIMNMFTKSETVDVFKSLYNAVK